MEDSPVIQEVPSKAYVNPQLDHSITSPKQAVELNRALSDFFKETDEKEALAKESAKAPPPPEAEVKEPEPEAKETPKPEVLAEESKEPKQPRKVPVKVVAPSPFPPAEPEPKPEAEALELSPLASQEQKGQFKQLKEILKESQQKLKLYQDVVNPLLRELGHDTTESSEALVTTLTKAADEIRSLRSKALTPDVSAELELLRGLQRAIDVVHAPEFAQQYTMPRDKQYFKVIDEIAANCGEDLQEFFKLVKEKYRPNNMDDAWWEDIESRMIKASTIERTRIHDNIAKLKQLQMDFDKAVVEKSSDQKGYQAWTEERQRQFSANYETQVRQAVSEAFEGPKKNIAGWLPQEVKGTPEERKKIEAHNAHFAGLQNKFSQFLIGMNSGPKQAALNTLEYLEAAESARELKEQLEASTSEVEDLKAEVTKLKAEVDKRRKISDTPMKPTAGASKNVPTKPKPPLDGLKSLNEAMKNFDWPS